MKKAAWALTLILIPAIAFAADDGHGRGGGQGGGRGSGAANGGGVGNGRGIGQGVGGGRGHTSTPTPRPHVITRMQRYTMPQPNVIRNPSHVVRDNNHVTVPQHDERGTPLRQTPVRVPPAQHNAIARNPTFIRNIHNEERAERTPGRYYWHDLGGRRYAHYYDTRGIHWYGFYAGPHFYWTRYYASRWWWYDPHFSRWVFWWDGYWWWPGPYGLTYVYVNNSYYPYENGEVVTATPEVVAPPAAAPRPSEGAVSTSPDGSRMVQIVGDQGDAYLYDRSTGQPTYLKYLGANVDKVRFSGGANGQPVQILVDYKDGSFALFDAEGNSASSPPANAAELPGTPPAATAPPPDAEPPAPEGTTDATTPPSGPPSAPPTQ